MWKLDRRNTEHCIDPEDTPPPPRSLKPRGKPKYNLKPPTDSYSPIPSVRPGHQGPGSSWTPFNEVQDNLSRLNQPGNQVVAISGGGFLSSSDTAGRNLGRFSSPSAPSTLLKLEAGLC
jgi:hypothetical protein